MVTIDDGQKVTRVVVMLEGFFKGINLHASNRRQYPANSYEELRHCLKNIEDQLMYDMIFYLSEILEQQVMACICIGENDCTVGKIFTAYMGRARYRFELVRADIYPCTDPKRVSMDAVYTMRLMN